MDLQCAKQTICWLISMSEKLMINTFLFRPKVVLRSKKLKTSHPLSTLCVSSVGWTNTQENDASEENNTLIINMDCTL